MNAIRRGTPLTFCLDLRRSARPGRAVGGSAIFCGVRRPVRGFDSRLGLRFPLADGVGLLFQNQGKLCDDRGTAEVVFALEAGDSGGDLLRSFGGYLSLTLLNHQTGWEVKLSLYGHELRLAFPNRPGLAHTVRVTWDHRLGFALSLRPHGHLEQTVMRAVTWHAYRQQYIGIEIGGSATELHPTQTRWQSTFTGWIRSVRLYARPLRPLPTPRPMASERPVSPAPRPLLVEGLRWVEWHDPPLLDSPLRYDVIPDRLSNYRRARRLHPELEQLYFGAPTAFEGLRNVARFVSNLWPHTSYWPWPRLIFDGRGDRLLAEIKAGQCGGMCGGYAHTMEECLWALGVSARRVQVYGHSSFEAYDHTHDKWILLETDNAAGHAGVWRDHAGNPCSIGELIALLEADRLSPGTLRDSVRFEPLGAHCPSGAIHNVHPESFLRRSYFRMGWYRRRDYRVADPPPSYWWAPPWFRLRPPEPYTPARLQRYVADWRHLYWSCDRVRVRANWRRSSRAIPLSLEPFQAQFFREFVISVNGRRIHTYGRHFLWHLSPGENRIEIATRNILGAVGHPWRAVVIRSP